MVIIDCPREVVFELETSVGPSVLSNREVGSRLSFFFFPVVAPPPARLLSVHHIEWLALSAENPYPPLFWEATGSGKAIGSGRLELPATYRTVDTFRSIFSLTLSQLSYLCTEGASAQR